MTDQAFDDLRLTNRVELLDSARHSPSSISCSRGATEEMAVENVTSQQAQGYQSLTHVFFGR